MSHQENIPDTDALLARGRIRCQAQERTTHPDLYRTGMCVTIQVKATEQYFHVVLLVMLYKVVLLFSLLIFKLGIKPLSLVCDHFERAITE